MKKQLIVVVHGVGVRSAGLVSDQLSAVLNEPALASRRASGMALEGWRPHSSDDFYLHEAPIYGHRGLLATFAAHLRRFRRYDPKDDSKITHERVVSDFYWGDISGTGNGPLQVLMGLVKIILGLSHAIRENAMDVFAGKGRGAVTMRRLARGAALMIHGPIAALNIVLLAGLFVAVGLGWLSGPGMPAGMRAVFGALSPEVVIGVASIGFGWIALRGAQVYLLRHLYSSVIGVGVLVLVLAGLDRLGWGLKTIDGFLIAQSCEASLSAGCAASYQGIALLGVRLMGGMMLCWAAVLVAAVVLGVASHSKAFPERPRVSSFVHQAIALMTLLWFLLMAGIWAAVINLLQVNEELRAQIMAALRLISPAAAALLALVVVGLWLHLRKGWALGKIDPAAYLPERDTLAERHRLIVGRALLGVLTLFLAVIVGTGVLSGVGVCPVGVQAQCAQVTRMLADWGPGVIAGIGVAGAALVGMGRSSLAMGIAIFTDVLVYLNDYSWRSREAALGTADAPKEAPFGTRTLVERGLGQSAGGAQGPHGYWLRQRIQDRMKALMATLIRNEAPDEIVIVSHSQGTMIAIDVIEASGVAWLDAPGRKVVLKLVTMGSPYVHIYNSYFPSQFRAPADRPLLQRVADKGILTDWVNIFRVDDFVGTHIDTRRNEGAPDTGHGLPREVPVPPNGHTNYWVDSHVFPELRAVLEF